MSTDEGGSGRTEAATTSTRTGIDVFVGRSPEMAVLESALAEAAEGQPRLVVVTGEPGIGKSRLLDELARTATATGTEVHWGRCREAGGAPPFWPWVQVLRTVSRRLDEDALAEAVGQHAGEIAQVLPELRERLGIVAEPAELDPDSARFRLFDALTSFLSATARSRTQVILLDDIHAADEPSLRLLEFLAADLRDGHVLVVVTTRTTEVLRSERLAELVHELDRAPTAKRLPLRGLGQPDVERYLAAVLGEDPSPGLAAAVAHQSDGNPLFLGEIVRLVQAEGLADDVLGSRPRLVLPSDVRKTILRRAAHVTERCNELLRVAAVIGREVDLDLLTLVSGASDEVVADAVDEAEDALLLAAAADAPGRVRFTHALVRDALYSDVPARRRSALHRQVGEALEQLHADAPDAVLAELALHFFEAAPIGEAGKAVAYARRAAAEATRVLAYEEAARLFELALQALALSREDQPATRCELLLALGDARMRAGDLEAAQATYLPAAELARAHGLAEQLARIALGYGGWFVWSALRGDPHFVPLIRDALDAIGPDDSPLRVQLLARYAGGAIRDDPDRAARTALCDEAVAMARRLGDTATLAYALDGRLGGLLWPDNAVERLALGTEMIELGRAIGARDRVQAGHIYRCHAAMELADRHTVEVELSALWRIAEEMRTPVTRWSATVLRVTLLLMEGGLVEAERLMEEARELSKAQSPDAPTSSLLHLFMLRKEQGRIEELVEPLQDHAARYPTRPLYRYALAHLHAVAGREREATWALEALAVHDFEDLPRNDEWLFGMLLLAEVVEVVDDQRRARLLYDLLLPHDEQVAVAALVVGGGAVARGLGVVAAFLGRCDDADDHFARAVAVNQRLGAPLCVARTEYDWARALLRSARPGDAERAAGLLEQAGAIAEGVGSVDLQDRIAELRGPRSRHAPGREPGTRRLRREGESWAVEFDGSAFRVQDTKGMRYLAHLLAHPGEAVHVLDLVGAAPALRGEGPGAAVLDDRAKTAYRARLADLDAEVDEAEAWGDSERAARAREEIQALSEEVAAALGSGGHDRRFTSPAERARQSVTKALRSSIDRVGRQCPALGRHLAEAVSTGTFCTYAPERDAPPWCAGAVGVEPSG